MNQQSIPEQLPFLERLCWQRTGIDNLTPWEMLKRYERGWHYRDIFEKINPTEAEFIQQLAQHYNSWLFNQMFTQDFHQKIITVLHQLNTNFLQDCHAYFGGGTFICLNYGEYRLSKDIDFLCSTGSGYRLLRQTLGQNKYNALFNTQNNITFPQEIQANQYGIRFPLLIEGTLIKFEIIMEGRIELEAPDFPQWSSVPCLNLVDCFAEKLLANADRWIDGSVESRDLIDLAVLRLNASIPPQAIEKAESAYPVIEPLKEAIANFQQKPNYRDKCFQSLRINNPVAIIDGLDLLAVDFGLEPTERTLREYLDQDDFI